MANTRAREKTIEVGGKKEESKTYAPLPPSQPSKEKVSEVEPALVC